MAATKEVSEVPETDWQSNKTLQQSLEFMLLNQIGCDVQFEVGDQKEKIKAHKVVLASRSPVFFALFKQEEENNKQPQAVQKTERTGSVVSVKNIIETKVPRSDSQASIKSNMSNKSTSMSIGRGGGWIDMNDSSMFTKQPVSSPRDTIKTTEQPVLETVEKQEKIYEIADTDFNTFKLFLSYLYTDHVELEYSTATKLAPLAVTYKVNGLLTQTIKCLFDQVNADNACSAFEVAHLTKSADLKMKCMYIITNTAREAIRSRDFMKLCPDCVSRITESTDLNASEDEIYEALIEWGEHECMRNKKEINPTNIRNVMGNIFYNIRFPAMNDAYYKREVEPKPFLTTEEKELIAKFKSGSAKKDMLPFKVHPRVNVAFHAVMRCQLDQKLQEHTGKPDALCFDVSEQVWLHGIAVFGAYFEQTNHVHLEVRDESHNVISIYQGQIDTVPNDEVYEVVLHAPILLQPDQIYTLLLTLVGPNKHFYKGIGGKNLVEFKDMKICFYDSNFSKNGTSIEGGQIPALLLST
ncbi:BTB/POZ domain-containing protein 6-like [Mytilus edulis]|uniref:BTB domain-containing protein n=1 Tax=Mytilus edulis TaxID=6550 RepID=A0A8S3PMI7_MYTED|nr:unnamed protein product [Mytilus edulis]